MTDRTTGRRIPLRALAITAANIGILLLLLLLTEVFLRIAGIPYSGDFIPSENAIAHFDDELGWDYIPNLSKTLKYGSYVRTVHFDAQGIRVPFPGYRLSRTRPSVLFIGGSYTMGHGLSYEETFIDQFEDLSGNAYQAVNLGVQAYGTDQALLALKRFAPKFNTRVVIYTFIEDHIYRNGNYDRRFLYPDAKVLGTKPLFALNAEGAPYLAKRPVRARNYLHSYLYDLLRMKLEALRGTGPPYPVALTKALILEMRNYCRARGIRFVMVNWRWDEDDYDDFSDLAVDMIDTLDDAPEGWERMRIPGEDHPDARATRYVAGLLLRYFRERSLLQRRK